MTDGIRSGVTGVRGGLSEIGVADVAMRPPRLDEVFFALTDGLPLADRSEGTDDSAANFGPEHELKEEIHHG
jgi:hypothetical protein